MLTAPYMHDGRFNTIAEVIEHYRSGIQSSPTLDASLRNNSGAPGITISLTEEAALIVFLHTLTDTEFVTNPAHAKPVALPSVP